MAVGAVGIDQRENTLPVPAGSSGRDPYKGSPTPTAGQPTIPVGENHRLTPTGPGIGTAEDRADLQDELLAGILDSMTADEREAFLANDDGTGHDPFDDLTTADRMELLGPHRKPPLCGFCGGRHRHNPKCVALTEGFLIRMPWGKHKGTPVAEVPHDYLRWLIGRGGDMQADLKQEIERVLGIEQ